MQERIKQIRKTLGLKQREFAEKIGVNTGTVGQWESGTGRPGAARVYQICSLFNVSRVWLETGAGDMFERETPLDAAARVERLAGDLVALLPENERRAFVDAVNKADKNRPK